MGNFKVTKSCIIVIIAAIFAAIMLPCPFFWGSTTLEYLEEAEFSGIMLWIYYITFAATLLFSVIQKKDFAKLASIINLAVIAFNVLIIIIDWGDGDFYRRMGFGMYGCVIASVIAMIACVKKPKIKKTETQ